MSIRTCVLTLILLLLGYCAICQETQYFHKIDNVISQEHSYTHCYKKIDSIKQTRRPDDSSVKVFFDRNVDFGFKHQRLNVVFNNVHYQVNLLLKGDIICLSSVSFDNAFYDNFYKKYFSCYIDTTVCLHFLKLRNNFYGSSKNLKDLKEDLIMNEDFAFYCGDGSPKTEKGKYIEHLVERKSVGKLTKLLQSVSCEQQAYGQSGLEALAKKGFKLSELNNKLLNYIKERDSEISICAGCFFNIVKKPSQLN